MRGILINDTVHTGKDLNLVMTAKDLPAPKTQTYTVAVPGRNGLLDLSEFLTGEPTYENRTLTFKFIGDGSRETVLNLIDVMCAYHGQYLTITTDDYLEWYFTGRAEVAHVDHGYYVEFTLTVDAQPFRYSLNPKVYEFGVCQKVRITLNNEGVSVIPTITVEGEATIGKDGVTVHISDGVYEDELIKLAKGDNELTIGTTGKVTFTYREAVI